MDNVRDGGVKGAIIGGIGSLMLFPPLGFAAIALTIAGGFIGRKLAENSEQDKETPKENFKESSRAGSSLYNFDSFKPKVDYSHLFPEEQPSLYKPLPEIKLDCSHLFQKEPSYIDKIIKQQEEVIRYFPVIKESESSLLNDSNFYSLNTSHGTSGTTTKKSTASSNNTSGLTGARGSIRNEEYFQRQRR